MPIFSLWFQKLQWFLWCVAIHHVLLGTKLSLTCYLVSTRCNPSIGLLWQLDFFSFHCLNIRCSWKERIAWKWIQWSYLSCSLLLWFHLGKSLDIILQWCGFGLSLHPSTFFEIIYTCLWTGFQTLQNCSRKLSAWWTWDTCMCRIGWHKIEQASEYRHQTA